MRPHRLPPLWCVPLLLASAALLAAEKPDTQAPPPAEAPRKPDTRAAPPTKAPPKADTAAVPSTAQPVISHHTVGSVTYSDTNGDGVVDRETRVEADGRRFVTVDVDHDGAYDERFEQFSYGGTTESEKASGACPRLAEIRAGTAAAKEWFILGFPAAQVLAILAAPVLVLVLAVLVVVRILRRRKRRAAAQESTPSDGEAEAPPSEPQG